MFCETVKKKTAFNGQGKDNPMVFDILLLYRFWLVLNQVLDSLTLNWYFSQIRLIEELLADFMLSSKLNPHISRIACFKRCFQRPNLFWTVPEYATILVKSNPNPLGQLGTRQRWKGPPPLKTSFLNHSAPEFQSPPKQRLPKVKGKRGGKANKEWYI